MRPIIALLSCSVVVVAVVAGCSSGPDSGPSNAAASEGSGRGCGSCAGEGSGAGGTREGSSEGSAGGCCRAGQRGPGAPEAAKDAPVDEEIVVAIPEGVANPGDQDSVRLSGGREVLIWKTADGYGAASAFCTHAGGSLRYNADAKRLECPNHGSRFNLDGSIINGPAQTPLLVYRAEARDGKLHLFPQPLRK